ncbi:ATP-grasp domain-containing protein [Mesobacillus harenae]|uniref:ATP-grasp domain-containing protein n=1 Tax=Mesobacillus harenae TaxID=2213203 RepID=UPI00158105D3|nr:ATP-grasp domain-containing protein [Mesobacillus harenae]
MKSIIFLGAHKSGTSREALKIAKDMGYYTILLTDRKKFLEQRDEFNDVHQMVLLPDLLDLSRVEEEINLCQLQGYKIEAIMSLIDPFVFPAAFMSKKFGLTQLSSDALYLMEEKTRFRKALQQLFSSPFFHVHSQNETAEALSERLAENLPLILKPVLSNGSKDIHLSMSKESLKRSIKHLESKFPGQPILIEEYLIGRQFLVEIVMIHGRLNIVGVIEQEFSAANPFIVTDYAFPALLKSKEYENLLREIEQILETLGMQHGSCHLEMKMVNNEWKLIEVNPRMSGGAMNKIIMEGSGVNLVQEIIKLNLKLSPSFIPTKNDHVYAAFSTVNTSGKLLKVTGKNKALKMQGVKVVYVKPRKGTIVTQPYSMGDRYAYVVAAGDSPEKARQIALSARNQIQFYIEPL